MSKPHVLVVDDRSNMLQLLAKVLRDDAQVHTASSGGEAIGVLESQAVAAIVCDLRMPDMTGLDVLRASKRLQPGAAFILMTAFATVPTAVEAMRQGAYDYVTKPFDPESLRAVVLSALSRAAVEGVAAQTEAPDELLPGVIGRSVEMKKVVEQLRRVAATDVAVLVLGETGTGKDRIARAVHELGSRSRERMITVNCAAIPGELLESELFGYMSGSFTGALRDRAGLFEEANQGTLFLDEIGEMRPLLQAKLARAVEQRAIRRLGESGERAVNVRLVAATHRDLPGMVSAGTFREDLWYRLNVAPIRIPALRERPEDIEPLVTHFLRERAAFAPHRGREVIRRRALDALAAYSWPGNVRQLRAAIERAGIEAGSDAIDVEHLPPEVLSGGSPERGRNLVSMTWQQAMMLGRREAGRQYLQALLKRFSGRIAEAAIHAGVERESFYRLLRRHGVHVDGTVDDSTNDEPPRPHEED
jgi:two-component system response regulator HydG